MNVDEGVSRIKRITRGLYKAIAILLYAYGAIAIVFGVVAVAGCIRETGGYSFSKLLDTVDPLFMGIVILLVTKMATYIIDGFITPKVKKPRQEANAEVKR
ncbi:hypothetical protein OKW41_002907 [Paraburkholderia sp. UCT70]|uniref:hypothetical protein n=1 Tax=Paraburkholderia sp. UCT70 TaxID=2991068 RepID=UPI003D1C2D76